MGKKKKHKWKCFVCKKANWAKVSQLEKNFPSDWHTTDEVVVVLNCRHCQQANHVRVSGLLQSKKIWELKAIGQDELGTIGTMVGKTTPMPMDMVRYLQHQQRIVPWADIHEKETLLIYQVYIEDGDIMTRLRGLTRKELMEDIEHILFADLDPAVKEEIIKDFRSFLRRAHEIGS